MNTFSQRFILRKTKGTKSIDATVYARVNINGIRTEFSVSRTCNPQLWNSAIGRVTGKNQAAKELNVYLNTIEVRIYEIHRELVASKQVISSESFKNEFRGAVEKSRLLLEIFKNHNDQMEALVGREYSINTFKKFRTCLSSLTNFVQWKYKKSDIDITAIGYEFINDFEFYLKSEKKVQHNSAMGDIKKLKKIIRQCVANNWLAKDPFMGYKVKIRDTSRQILLENEIEIIATKEISIERLSLVRDIFLFCCYTGVSFRDVAELRDQDIAIGVDGEKWIWTTRFKTGTPTHIPLLPRALEIIDRYKSDPRCINRGRLLPVLSNQKMNSYLKELTDFCRIKKELTFHCARHTFATTITLSNGVPIESVSKMLGHRNLRTTQIYAKVLDKKVGEDMRLLNERLSKGRPEVK